MESEGNIIKMERLARKLDRYTAGPMFLISLLFLFGLAGILHLDYETAPSWALPFCEWLVIVLYPLFVIELLTYLFLGNGYWKQHLLFCLFPPFRLGCRDHVKSESIWLPKLGWSRTDRELRDRLEKSCSIPMIIIALMVLPLMAVEHFWSEAIRANPQLALSTQTATGLIWLSFTVEFVVMISVVKKKLVYCKDHWVDIAIICLPLIAFLRVARLGRLIRLNQLSRTARVYRLRGVLMRTYRALLLLDVLERLLRPKPESRLARKQEKLKEKEKEIEKLQAEIRKLEALVEHEAEEETSAVRETA